MLKIDHSLLTSRIGGLFMPDQIRKTNFHFQGRKFLNELVCELGLISAKGFVEVIDPKPRESGMVSYKSDRLHVKLYENPLTRNGVVFAYTLFAADGSLQKNSETFIRELSNNERLSHFIYELKAELNRSASLFH